MEISQNFWPSPNIWTLHRGEISWYFIAWQNKIKSYITLITRDFSLYLSNAVNQLGDKNKSEAIVTSKPHYVAVLFFVCRYLMVKKNVLLLWANKVKQIISGRHDVYIVLLYQLFFLQERKRKSPIKMSSKYLVESRIVMGNSWEVKYYDPWTNKKKNITE